MFSDLREFIKIAEEMGQVRQIEGAHWDLEIGTITELAQSKPDGPLLLFDKIEGYLPGFRVATNVLNNNKLIALAFGLPVESKGVPLVKGWREKIRRGLASFGSVEVRSGPIEENVITGNDINLWKFPSPRWHEYDGGRYIGTGDIVITRDPEEGWINLGTFRVQVHDEKTANVHVEPNKHTDFIRRKYWAQGKSCPVAVVCGMDPRFVLVGGAPSREGGVNEYEYAGAFAGRSIEVIKGKSVNLPIPASAEIVLEGEILPPGIDDRVEGPFGEGKGYYDGGEHEPVMRVTCVMHRNDPIMLGCPPLSGDYELRYGFQIPRAAAIWDELDRMVPGVCGVWLLNEARDPFAVISIRQQYAGHAKETALAAVGCFNRAFTRLPCRFVVIVDEDIDPSNLSQVMLAIGTRCDPAESIDIIRGLGCARTETTVSPEKKKIGDITLGKCFIYACKPYSWRDEFPRLNKCRPELLEETRAKWGAQLFGR